MHDAQRNERRLPIPVFYLTMRQFVLLLDRFGNVFPGPPLNRKRITFLMIVTDGSRILV
jgi:hypothetical protein